MVEKISSRQAIYLITISRVATAITTMSTIRMSPKNQDIWLIVIGSFFYSLLLYSPMLFLSTRFRDMSLVKFMEKIFGKFIGKTIGLSYCLHLVLEVILFTYIAVQLIRTTFLTMVPAMVTISLTTFTCIYIAMKGIEVIGRFAELSGPVLLGGIIVIFILGASNIDLSILLPIYSDSTFVQINKGSLELFSIFTDIFILTTIVPNLKNKEDSNKIYLKSIIYSLAIIIIAVVFTQATLGIEQARHSNFPFLTFVRLIDAKFVLQRIESIFILMWLTVIIFRISIYIYIASQGLREVLNRENGTICVYIVGILTSIVTYYIAEYNPQMTKIISIELPELIYYLIFKTGIPLIAVIIYLFRRKTLKGEEVES